MILVSPPYRTNWGCLLADSGTIRREVTRPVAGRPSMFVYVRLRKHPRDFWRTVSVNHSRNRSGKVYVLDNTAGTSQSSKLLRGYRSTGLQPVPGRPQLGLRSSPRSRKDDSTLRLAYSALELSPWAMPAQRCGEPLDARPSRRGPAQAFSSIASYVPCAGQRYCAGH